MHQGGLVREVCGHIKSCIMCSMIFYKRNHISILQAEYTCRFIVRSFIFSEHVTKDANYNHVNKDVLPLDEKAVNDMGVFHQGQTIGSFNSLVESEVDTEEKLKFF